MKRFNGWRMRSAAAVLVLGAIGLGVASAQEGPMGPKLMGQDGTGQGPMGQGPMGQGPMGQGPMGEGRMGQGPMGEGRMGQGPMAEESGEDGRMGPGPMGPMRPGPRGVDFASIDTDGDGILTRAELQARAVARLTPADANGDGALDRAEFIAALPSPPGALLEVFSPNPAEQIADRILATMGATEAGKVTVVELADSRVNMLLAGLDTNRDAAISRAEADAARERHAARARHRMGDDRPGKGSHGHGDGPGFHRMAPWGPDDDDSRG